MARPKPGNKQKSSPAILTLRKDAGGSRLARMKVGLISDTHNRLPETRRALDLLLENGAQHLVHCGDAGEDVLDLVSAACQEHGIRAHVAIGNCDRMHLEDLPFRPRPAGIERAEAPEFVLDGQRCIALHGDRSERLEQAVSSGNFDFVFTGHTHSPADRKKGRTRLLNPGSPVQPRNGPPTVALLDLATGHILWLPM